MIDKEERIQQHIEYSNMTRIEAEFSVAIECGEITGDVYMIDEGDDMPGNDSVK